MHTIDDLEAVARPLMEFAFQRELEYERLIQKILSSGPVPKFPVWKVPFKDKQPPP